MVASKPLYYGFFRTIAQTLAASNATMNTTLLFDPAYSTESYISSQNIGTDYVFIVPKTAYYLFDYSAVGYPSVSTTIALFYNLQIAPPSAPTTFVNTLVTTHRINALTQIFRYFRYCTAGEHIRFNASTSSSVGVNGMQVAYSTLLIQEQSFVSRPN